MVYIGGAIPAAFRQRRSSKGRKGYLTATPYYHPGMPKIGAIEKFRANAEVTLKGANQDLTANVEQYNFGYGAALPVPKTDRNRIASKRKQGVMSMEAYFDSSGFTNQVDNIANMVRDWGTNHLQRAMEQARQTTAKEIKTMHRQFKGSYYQTQKAEGDIYHTIADSLNYEVSDQSKTKNQFISVIGGSFDSSDTNEPTGVLGSRGGNIGEMTERGTGRSVMTGQILGGTARIKDKLKTR